MRFTTSFPVAVLILGGGLRRELSILEVCPIPFGYNVKRYAESFDGVLLISKRVGKRVLLAGSSIYYYS